MTILTYLILGGVGCPPARGDPCPWISHLVRRDTGCSNTGCRLSVDPHFGAPLYSLAAPTDCSGPPGPDANDVYLFPVLCYKRMHALACQTPLDPSGVMEQWRLSSGFITHARNLVQGDLPSLIVLIASNDPHWQPKLHYPIAAGARVITSLML